MLTWNHGFRSCYSSVQLTPSSQCEVDLSSVWW